MLKVWNTSRIISAAPTFAGGLVLYGSRLRSFYASGRNISTSFRVAIAPGISEISRKIIMELRAEAAAG